MQSLDQALKEVHELKEVREFLRRVIRYFDALRYLDIALDQAEQIKPAIEVLEKSKAGLEQDLVRLHAEIEETKAQEAQRQEEAKRNARVELEQYLADIKGRILIEEAKLQEAEREAEKQKEAIDDHIRSVQKAHEEALARYELTIRTIEQQQLEAQAKLDAINQQVADAELQHQATILRMEQETAAAEDRLNKLNSRYEELKKQLRELAESTTPV
jgi:chromosome segregation ATPase